MKLDTLKPGLAMKCPAKLKKIELNGGGGNNDDVSTVITMDN